MAYTTIDDPSAYFQTLLYTGNASSRSLTNDGNSNLQPDLVWTRKRNEAQNHCVTDSSRAVGNIIFPDATDAESATQLLTSFDSDGFSINNNALVNDNTDTYVAWQWKANGGTTASNSNGGVTSTVQANTTAGFSIVQWTGDGSDETVGHGLSSAPDIYIIKNREDSTDWRVGQDIVTGKKMTDGNGYYMELNDDKASTNPGSATTWGSTPTAPTSSVFTVGSNNAHNGSSDDFVAYCFHSVQGYSKIGTYTGNGNAGGPFIYLGFKPSMIIKKGASGTGDWHISDNKQNSHNPHDNALRPNVNNATETGNTVDFLSNGFKIRNTGGSWNSSGSIYIYMAFAEHPFVSSEGVPTTAR
jgi:hypothetical protein